jgi:hypothetical protein
MLPGTVSSIGPMFGNLLGRPPSLNALRPRFLVFVRAFRRYYAVARLPAVVRERLMAHRLLPPARQLLAGGNGVSRFSCMKCLCMLGSSTPQVRAALALSCVALLPSLLSDAVSPLHHTISELNTQPTDTPCPTLQVQPPDYPRMARGQGGSLLLPCTTLSFATPCRFIPALSRHRVSAPRG